MRGETRVLLTPEVVGAPPGSPVAAVEVFDARSVRVGGSVLYAGTTSEVLLPPEQHFLVRGWTPSGRLLQSTFTTGSGRADRVTVGAAPDPGDTGPPAAFPRPERPELRVRTPFWQPSRSVDDWEPGLVEWEASPPRGREWATDPRPTCVVLPGVNGGASRGWWVPYLSAVELVPVRWASGARTTHVVRLRPGLARTLLGYLRSGDLRAAAVIADDYLSWYGSPGAPDASPTADLAVGYYLLLHRRPEAAHWIRELNRVQHGSPDASLLEQSSPHTRGPVSPELYAGSLFSVLALGPPAVAEGLPLLLSYVRRARHAHGSGRQREFDLDRVVRDLRHCLGASRGGLLTSFTTADDHVATDHGAHAEPDPETEPPPTPHVPVGLFPARVLRGPLVRRVAGGLVPPVSAAPSVDGDAAEGLAVEQRPLYRLPVFSQVGNRADDAGGGARRSTWKGPGLRCVLRALEGSRVDISLVASGRAPEGDLARFTVDTGAGRQNYLMALVPGPGSERTGELRMDVVGDEVYASLAADLERWDTLSAEDAEAVTRSVAASTRQEVRNLWRRLARNAGPELRAAVLAALRSRPE